MSEDLAWALHRFALALYEVDLAVAQRLGVSPLEFTAIKHIAMAGRPLGPGDIARLVGVSSGSASELVDRLHRSGYVERRSDSRDRRRRVVHLAPNASHRIEVELREASVSVDRLAADLPPELVRSLIELLEQLGGRLTAWARSAATTER